MTLSGAFALACLWALAANVVAMVRSRDGHRRAAMILMMTGIPVLGLVTLKGGPVWGGVLLACGALLLRWPLIALWRRLLVMRSRSSG